MEEKKRRTLFLALGALLLTGTLVLSLLPDGAARSAAAVEPESAYVLREYDGCVAIFCGGKTAVPATVTDIEVRLLPEWDRQALAAGIAVDDPRELSMLLEDLGS